VLEELRSEPLSLPVAARPLLKWAGGKRQLLPVLRQWVPERFNRYFEPFLGSGALFFDLAGSGELKDRSARLTDANGDLIDCYQIVRDQTDAVIAALADLAADHARRGSDCYYDVRDRQFNPARAAGERATPRLAAMLIYLNRTGFNGLYRLNRRGAFNVPAGRYERPRICDPAHLRTVAATLRQRGVTLTHGAFDVAIADAGAGDFIYCDPPYAPLSATASFANYTAAGFTDGDQARLQRAVIGAAERGATVVLSNSSAPSIMELYQAPEAQSARFVVHRLPARRAINSRASARGVVDELLVTNATRRELTVARPRMLKAGIRTRERKRA
jgi:DNA adenine methylase